MAKKRKVNIAVDLGTSISEVDKSTIEEELQQDILEKEKVLDFQKVEEENILESQKMVEENIPASTKKYILCPFCDTKMYTQHGSALESSWCEKCGKAFGINWHEE